MHPSGLRFSIVAHSAWAPGIVTAEQWQTWAAASDRIELGAGPDPAVAAMPAMLRRRAGFFGKMALEVAYQCLGERTGVPVVFCSRHGEVGRAVDLLGELARGEALSPTAFGMAVHNAIAGLFSIARTDRANQIAMAGAGASVEHAVVEACGLLADGVPEVLLLVCDCPLPEALSHFQDCDEQPFAWAWLMSAAGERAMGLALDASPDGADASASGAPGALDVLRFQLSRSRVLERTVGPQRWTWSRDA